MHRKTLFVSMFSHLVIGNFSVPNGVFEQFVKKRPKDVRIVILTDDVEHYKSRLAPYASDNFIIEGVTKYEPKRFFVRAFRFFYSYLIFTGTTHVLATLGARADLPPAGGNRHLAFLKSAIANSLGRIPFVKRRIIPAIFSKVFYERPYAYLFEKYKPASVFATCIAFIPDSELIMESRRRGIQTIGMACNWDHLNKYFIPIRADKLIVQNEPMRTEAVTLQGYRRDDVSLVGFPQFDMYAGIESRVVTRSEFFSHFKIPESARLIVFISGTAYSLDEADILKNIADWIEAKRFAKEARLMVRPYVVLRDRKREEEKYKSFVDNPVMFFNWMKSSESPEARRMYLGMLYHADVVISMFSTTAIEAALLDKPTIAIGFDGYAKRPPHQTIRRMERMHHFKHVIDTGNVKLVRGFEELFTAIDAYLQDPSLDREKRKHLIDDLCYKADGHASERIADTIFSSLS